MIQLEQATKIYNKGGERVAALPAFDLHVREGEFVSVRGPSGSGKSTLLLMVGGMVRPSGGTVRVQGQDVYAMGRGARNRWRAQNVGFVFQMFHLLPYLSVLENVMTGAPAGSPGTRRQAQAMLESFGLGKRLSHRPGELSVGERQRVAVARALLKEPPVLLADEPTGNLDPESASRIMDHITDYHQAGGTVLLVTHEPIAAERAERTVELLGGGVPAGEVGAAGQ